MAGRGAGAARGSWARVRRRAACQLPSLPLHHVWCAIACCCRHAATQVPFAVVFTKCDARKKGGPTPAANAAAFKRSLAEQYEDLPAFFETSAAQGLGRSEVLGYLASLRQLEAAEGELL